MLDWAPIPRNASIEAMASGGRFPSLAWSAQFRSCCSDSDSVGGDSLVESAPPLPGRMGGTVGGERASSSERVGGGPSSEGRSSFWSGADMDDLLRADGGRVQTLYRSCVRP